MSTNMNNLDGINVDPKSLINLATQNKIPWEMLALLLETLIPTLDKSKQVIKLLIQELQNIHLKLQKNQNSTGHLQANDMDSHSVEMDQDDDLNQTVEDRHEFDDYDKTSETPNIDDVELDIESNEKIFCKEDESEVSIEKERYIFRNEFTQFSSLKRQEGIYPGKKCKKLIIIPLKNQNQQVGDETVNKTENVNEFEEISDETFDSIDNEENDLQNHGTENGENLEKEFSNEDPQKVNSKKSSKYQCKICPSSFKTSWHLKRHETIHNAEKLFKCKFCPKKVRRADNLINHEARHAMTKYSCKICFQSFNTPQILSQHEKVHVQIIRKCNICKKTFNKSTALEIHKNTHTGEKPFKCKLCPKSYADPSSCRQHYKRNHC